MANNSSLWFPSIQAKMLAGSRRVGKCLLWQGATAASGYGQVSYDGHRFLVHRAGLELKLGRPIQKGMWACHTRHCPHKNCWAFAHLYEGTPQSNRDDDRALGKIRWGEESSQAVLTAEKVRRIRADARLLREIAADFGVSEGHVSEIKNRKKWAQLD